MQKQFRLPKDIPISEYPRPETYLEEGRHLIDEAKKQGIILRVMGPIALYYYFPEYADLYNRMERMGERVFADIDYAAYGKHRSQMVPFFENQGYELEKRAAMISGGTRLIFFSSNIPMIDVFFDKLDYNHMIDFRGRLEIHPRCVSMADLMLQKLQIVQINDKDLKDAILLLLAAPFSETDKEAINIKYIAKLFSDDWGFYHTATNNLMKIKEATNSVKVLTNEQRGIVGGKLDTFLQYIKDTPKTGKWKRRANIGAKRSWYKEVSDWD